MTNDHIASVTTTHRATVVSFPGPPLGLSGVDKVHDDIIRLHLPYEIAMIRATIGLIDQWEHMVIVSGDSRPIPQTAHATVFAASHEAFCIHARCLADFYQAPLFRNGDVYARHFTDGTYDAHRLDSVKADITDIRQRINKQICHLTEDRFADAVNGTSGQIDKTRRHLLFNALMEETTAFCAALVSPFDRYRAKLGEVASASV